MFDWIILFQQNPCILSARCCTCCMFQTQMDPALTLTALIDFYSLKKEGKVTGGASGEPCLTAGKTKIEGMFPILSHLNSKTNIMGQSPLEQALVRQWITFQVYHLAGLTVRKTDIIFQ